MIHVSRHFSLMPSPKNRTVPHSPEDRVEDAGPPDEVKHVFRVKLPGAGEMDLANADEVLMWNDTRDRYIKDYGLSKGNDLIQLGAILTHTLILYRAQRDLASAKNSASNAEQIEKAAKAIRDAERSLGLDKATREKGGQQTVADYITRLKKAGFQYGVHISERVTEYERVAMEARWRIRLLRNGETEDKAYHGVQTDKQIVNWLEKELAGLEQKDREWAREKGALFVGKL